MPSIPGHPIVRRLPSLEEEKYRRLFKIPKAIARFDHCESNLLATVTLSRDDTGHIESYEGLPLLDGRGNRYEEMSDDDSIGRPHEDSSREETDCNL